MAKTSMLTGNALTVKLYSAKAFATMIKGSVFGHMANRGTIFEVDELMGSQKGDEVTLNRTGILTGLGVGEGSTLKGNEEALDNGAFQMALNVVRHGVLNPNDDTIEQKRTLVNFEERSRDLLAKWHASRVDASVLNQLAGNNATSITVDGAVYTGAKLAIVLGNNSIAAPTANRIIRAASRATDQAITSSDTFTLDLVDAAVETLMNTYPHAEPLEGESFDLYLSPPQVTDLKRDTTGAIQWYTNELAAMQGGQIDGNVIRGANHYSVKPIGKYGNVFIYNSFRVAQGVNSSTSAPIANVRRAVLCGREALAFASKFPGTLSGQVNGQDMSVPFKFFEDLDDYEYCKGIEGRMIYGAKKVVFQGEDLGSIVISTYAAPHTS